MDGVIYIRRGRNEVQVEKEIYVAQPDVLRGLKTESLRRRELLQCAAEEAAAALNEGERTSETQTASRTKEAVEVPAPDASDPPQLVRMSDVEVTLKRERDERNERS